MGKVCLEGMKILTYQRGIFHPHPHPQRYFVDQCCEWTRLCTLPGKAAHAQLGYFLPHASSYPTRNEKGYVCTEGRRSTLKIVEAKHESARERENFSWAFLRVFARWLSRFSPRFISGAWGGGDGGWCWGYYMRNRLLSDKRLPALLTCFQTQIWDFPYPVTNWVLLIQNSPPFEAKMVKTYKKQKSQTGQFFWPYHFGWHAHPFFGSIYRRIPRHFISTTNFHIVHQVRWKERLT